MILDGKDCAAKWKDEIKNKVLELNNIYNEEITLAICVVGDNEASKIYVRNKVKAASYVGITAKVYKYESDITEEYLLEEIEKLNKDASVHGIIVQLPVPKHMHEQRIIDTISPLKDVDGFSTLNKGMLFAGAEAILPATPYGIIKLLKSYNIEISGKEALVIGRSNIVGKPMAHLLLQENATVTVAHSKTKNLPLVSKRADIVVVAIGRAKMITTEYIKPGAVVVDVGMNRDSLGLCGDVDFKNVSNIASYITPVPGGVGPLTIAGLLENTVKTYILQKK